MPLFISEEELSRLSNDAKFLSISGELSDLQSQNAQLQSSLDERIGDLAQAQSQKHQLHLQSIAKDGEIERLTTEVSELRKSKRQLLDMIEQKDLEIADKNAAIKTYLDKIINLTDNAAQKEARLSETEAALARAEATCSRLSQEKELIERHNTWLNEELTAKVDNLIESRRKHAELEADMSAKLGDELCSSKEVATSTEERFSAELSTTHLGQVEDGYKERLEKEVSARKQFEKETADLKEKLQKCEAEIQAGRKANELDRLPIGNFTTEICISPYDANDLVEDNRVLVPKIPVGVSETALAASLLRDGWSVLCELEEKAVFIMDERAEYEKMCEAYSMINQKLQNSTSEHSKLEKTIQELQADLRRHERDNSLAEKVIADLERQLTFKDISGLVEQNVQLRSLVRDLSDQIESKEMEFKRNLEIELKRQTDEAASKVAAVLQRAEEQGCMIESLHNSMLEEEISYFLKVHRAEIISVRSERDKLALEANFAREKLESVMKEAEHQLIVDYQKKLRESSESLLAAEEHSRKLTMEATLDTIQSAEGVREEARAVDRRRQDEYVKQIEKEWAEAKRQLQEERDNVRTLMSDREQTLKNAMKQVEEMGKELANALHACAAAEARAAVSEARLSDLEKKLKSSDFKILEIDGGTGPSSISTNEAEKLKKSLEAELGSLKERVSELEYENSLKSKEIASATAEKEEALSSAFAEITSLKEETAVKSSQIVALEIQISSLKENLEKAHEKWRAAQANYERQAELKVKWEVDKSNLEESRKNAERKYDELNEQLENALKAAETAQATFNAERANSRAVLMTEEEIKALQNQVMEMNLLRESNMQLREENKHNFEECQEILKEKAAQIEEIMRLLSKKQETISKLEQDLAISKLELNEKDKKLNDNLVLEANIKSDMEKQKKLVLQYKILEKTVERQREELKKEKDEHQNEKVKRIRCERTIMEAVRKTEKGKATVLSELEKYQQALKRLAEEVEKLKHAEGNLPEGPVIASSSTPVATPHQPAKAYEERRSILAKTNIETRKTGRKLVRPRFVKAEEPQGDVDMSEATSHDADAQGTVTQQNQPGVRKRPASAASELSEDLPVQGEMSTDVAVPAPKKSKGSDPLPEAAEGQTSAVLEEAYDTVGDAAQGSTEDAAGGEKEEEAETMEEKFDEPKETQVDGTNEVESLENKNNVFDDILDKPGETEMVNDDEPKNMAEQDSQQENESEREEGELAEDIEGGGDVQNVVGSSETGDVQHSTPMASPSGVDDEGDVGDINDVNDEGDVGEEIVEEFDKSNDANNQTSVETDQTPETASGIAEPASTSTSVASETEVSKHIGSSATPEAEAVKRTSPASTTSTVVNLQERARERAMLRQAGVVPPPGRGRARPAMRGRVARGRTGRGRGQNPDKQ
ncbi:Tetratricopeptide, MLP1/MLP2-like protein [Corchorus olitorius]|uniref:Tetratricopeptide, MLP1/MLP2-like protein n=1 Tax=Corchorus olitorius TaxID=93759 RepID=A0A1R3I5C4_9ROSI|nr:Tetratricopeptide, MLP1/MLP2-like protein [Corchorus olitorius]